ncbi:MAG TPA: PVC-type heme-binding CxxCH protein, partial [Verrucomicrobiae bacterium]|nr:PVC-type heme-binding CxxCH protein [Verrucomicrobiae bacterium]
MPDGPPEVLLNGWDADKVRHNIVNGLKWGPDGWLYGRHGIMATSSVGKPGTPEEERVKLNCGIWRYHPTRKVFEVVCHGTTNPWGSDWDEHGRMFFINTVIGHLWQAIPGAFFKRMYGEPLVPFRYGLMDQAADHYHWDTGHTWQDSRSAPSSDALGGGHAHSGLMIYQGQNWPTQYRGGAFMLNYHGRRINEDRLEPLDSGAVGRHAPDLARFEDPWFRGIDLDYGPDGSVYVLDWSDTGECHGTDNVNRDSGRIYRISWAGTNSAPQPSDSPSLVASLETNGLALASADELLQMQLQANEWFARHSRRLLQERATAGALPAHFASRILALFEQTSNGVEKLRLLFTLHDIGGDSRDWLLSQLGAQDEFLRGWAVRFLAETSAQDRGVQAAFARLAKAEPSPIVRLELASALQRLALADREGVAAALLDHAEDQKDRYLPLMLWYGVEPVTAKFPTDAIRLAAGSKIPIVRQYISRRLGDMMAKRPEAVNDLLRDASLWPAAQQIDVLRGLAEALGKTGHATMPSQWMALRERTAASRNDELVELTRSLGAIFGDPW